MHPEHGIYDRPMAFSKGSILWQSDSKDMFIRKLAYAILPYMVVVNGVETAQFLLFTDALAFAQSKEA